ncbi:hypothetical protein EXA18_00615 [Vibrio cincinnatiensis]|uniref:hypothetical protein n=1 Tax=Vibrio cincinnatiensis TaxID=675 RepID=UPI001EDDDAE6|nr:hypothetical protein [Vibrio cincinnatiensis]MCG3741985.1 hypothetical protein [Vibrio cincinnatiensis]
MNDKLIQEYRRVVKAYLSGVDTLSPRYQTVIQYILKLLQPYKSLFKKERILWVDIAYYKNQEFVETILKEAYKNQHKTQNN